MLQAQSETIWSTCTEISTVSFRFKIPKTLPFAASASASDARLQELCPTMAMGRLYRHGPDGQPYMQPLILYRLSASVRPKGEGPHCPRVGISRLISIMPTTNRPPPMYINLSEPEYTLYAISKVRKHFYGHCKGYFEFFAGEPQPLNIRGCDARLSTCIFLKTLFKQGKGVSQTTIEPYNWSFTIRTRLQRRIFYATKTMACEPTVRDARMKPEIALRTEVLQSEEREYTELTWRNDHVSPNGTIAVADDKNCPWTVVVPIILTTDRGLLPSFFSATAALRYSVLLDVHISRPWLSHATLEVPVQVFALSQNSSHSAVSSTNHSENGASSGQASEEDDGDEALTRPPEYRYWAL